MRDKSFTGKLHKTVISTELAPAAIGPYSQAIIANGFVYCSGQLPIEPTTGQLVGTTTEQQTRQLLSNLAAVLEASDTDLEHVVKTTAFLIDMADFAEFNAVYAEFFPENSPARSAVQVAALPKGARVEVEAIAVKP